MVQQHKRDPCIQNMAEFVRLIVSNKENTIGHYGFMRVNVEILVRVEEFQISRLNEFADRLAQLSFERL